MLSCPIVVSDIKPSELLLQEGWKVFCLDDLSTGTAENVAGPPSVRAHDWRGRPLQDRNLLAAAVYAVLRD